MRQLTEKQFEQVEQIARMERPTLRMAKHTWFAWDEDDDIEDEVAFTSNRSKHALNVYHALKDEDYEVRLERSRVIADWGDSDVVVLTGVAWPDWAVNDYIRPKDVWI